MSVGEKRKELSAVTVVPKSPKTMVAGRVVSVIFKTEEKAIDVAAVSDTVAKLPNEFAYSKFVSVMA